MTAASLGVFLRYGPALSSIAALRRGPYRYLLGEGRNDHLALTFDDGPDPLSTPLILKELDRLSITATFFMLGSMAEANPSVVHEVLSAGHEVAVHGNWHRNHLFRSARTIRYDIERAVGTIGAICGTTPTYFRPPYGVATRPTLLTASQLALKPVLWGAWGRDWRRLATPTSVLHDVTKDLRPGTTILLHDADCTSYPGSFRATLGALRPLFELCQENRLQLGPLREHGF
ncbi:MAG: polysaccharide deacetylase family protein [Acidimicrobiales bacterium]